MRAWPRPPLRATFPRKPAAPVPKVEPCACGVSAGPLFHRDRGASAYGGVLRCPACGLCSNVKAGPPHLLAQFWNEAVHAKRAARAVFPSTAVETDQQKEMKCLP